MTQLDNYEYPRIRIGVKPGFAEEFLTKIRQQGQRERFSAALVGHPVRRRAVACDAGWRVTDSSFVTTDRVLAEAVAREFDRLDQPPSMADERLIKRTWK